MKRSSLADRKRGACSGTKSTQPRGADSGKEKRKKDQSRKRTTCRTFGSILTRSGPTRRGRCDEWHVDLAPPTVTVKMVNHCENLGRFSFARQLSERTSAIIQSSTRTSDRKSVV